MRKNKWIWMGLLGMGLLSFGVQSRHLQEDYASEVLRFHVIANSDSTEDQELKLQVRDQVGCYVSNLLEDAKDKEETVRLVQAHMDDIVSAANETICQAGYDYEVTAAIEQVDFPKKTYGAFSLPEGNYTSLQIRIGEAKGKNWWCVMYPNMCFRDSTYEVVSDGEKEQMYQVFTLYQYRSLIESPDKVIRFRYL